MSNREQLIRARVGILTMAAKLKNVAKVCRLAGVSRSQFYAMRKAYETYGREGLAPRLRRNPQMPNRTPASIESQILLKTQINPTVSYIRLAGLMKLEGIAVTPTMVRYVWQRHGLSTRATRLYRVKKHNGKADSVNEMNVPATFSELDATLPLIASATSPPSRVTGTVSDEVLGPYGQTVQRSLTK